MLALWIPRSISEIIKICWIFVGFLLTGFSTNSTSMEPTVIPLRLKFSNNLTEAAAPGEVRELGVTKLSQYEGAITVRPARPSDSDMEELVLEVDVNQQGLDDSVIVLRTGDGAFYFAEEDLDRWRLRKPGVVALKHSGRNYFPGTAIPGANYDYDRVKQALHITAAADAFSSTATKVANSVSHEDPILSQPGGFLNYNISATRTTDVNTLSGTFDAVFFSSHGALSSSFLSPTLNQNPNLIRLQTTYVMDVPERLASFRLGDATTQGGSWGLPVLFGGVQYGTNYGTQPGFVRSPTAMTVGGQATLPSTVDVFVNNALVSRQSVPPGPFSISNIPLVSGRGEARLVVRDLLGREQVITQPFYGTSTLLKQGLTEYSYELGLQRMNFGMPGIQYGKGLASATYRWGLTDMLTSEVHTEASATAAALGASGVVQIGQVGIANASLVTSHSDAGFGRLMAYGLDHQGRELSFSIHTQLAGTGFSQIGLLPEQLPKRRQDVLSMGLPIGRFGSLSLSRVSQKSANQSDVQVTSFSYTLQVGRFAQLGITAMRAVSDSATHSLFMTLTIPLGTTTSASIASERTRNSDGNSSAAFTNTLQQGMPVGPGYGYRVQEREGSYLGTLNLQNNVGSYQIEASRSRDGAGGTPLRLGATGGIGMVGGHIFVSRAITDSFGVVRVADYPDVRVLQDNQVVGRTDTDGYAVLPRLRAYDRNVISVDPIDLPMDAVLGSLKLVAIPYFRSGVLINFPVKRERGATLHIILDDGSDLPSGALSKIEGKEDEFPVALRGEAYLTGFEDKNRIHFSWNNQSCDIDVTYPEKTTENLPHLGTFVCTGVKP